MAARGDIRLYLALLVGVVAVSFAAIFIRLAEAPSIVVAAYRLTLASLIVAPAGFVRCREEMKALDRRDVLYALLSGFLLSLHFALWIASLSYTTVASSVVFVSTHPLFVALASHLFTQDKVTRLMLCGIVLAVLGGMAIGCDDLVVGTRALSGDLLALGGAMMGAGYLMVGRRLRPKMSLLAYISVVYSVAALGALMLSVLSGRSFVGYSPQTYVMFVLLAVVPQIIGHSSFNWALRHLSAASVAVTILGEPVGSTVLAYFILREAPTLVKVGGAALILGGIYFSLREERVERRMVLQD